METNTPAMKPGTLWPRVLQRTHHALQCGAMNPIPTKCELVSQAGIEFLVRIVSNIARKNQAIGALAKKSSSAQQNINPFLPFEADLFVADISDTHVCLLNKFNVVEHHLLIVTRSFEPQETLLTLQDFEAMWTCMAEFDGLAFYNAGVIAGASQPHKHLQMVPLPLAPTGPQLPIEPLLRKAAFSDTIGMNPVMPFAHAIARLEPTWIQTPQRAAKTTLDLYYAMLDAVGLQIDHALGEPMLSAPYNLLFTRHWMWLVPRTAEFAETISINALGFAGALLVKNEQEMQTLRDQGPLMILKSVSMGTDHFALHFSRD